MPLKKLKRGFKTLSLLRKGKKAGKIAKKLRESRGAETSGVRSEKAKRIHLKKRAKRILK